MPDTSCTITLLNLDVALRNGIHIDRTKTVELYHTAGETMLISCDDLLKLRVIPADFPNAVLTVK